MAPGVAGGTTTVLTVVTGLDNVSHNTAAETVLLFTMVTRFQAVRRGITQYSDPDRYIAG